MRTAIFFGALIIAKQINPDIPGHNTVVVFAMRLTAFEGIFRQSITQLSLTIALKNTRFALKPSRVSFCTLIILNLTPLAIPDNRVACKREVSFATYLTVWGLNEKSTKALRHKKNSKYREWMKTLSSRSLEGNSYDGLADRVNRVCILETVNTFILSSFKPISGYAVNPLRNNIQRVSGKHDSSVGHKGELLNSQPCVLPLF